MSTTLGAIVGKKGGTANSEMGSDQQRIQRMERLLKRDAAGKPIRRRDLLRVLGKKAAKDFDAAWRAELRARDKKPAEIVEYARRLKVATYHYTIAERYSGRRNPKAKRAAELAESRFENALEYLRDVVTGSDLQMWLDRDVNGPDVDLYPDEMPKPIWASNVRRDRRFQFQSRKKDIARQIVQSEFDKMRSEQSKDLLLSPIARARRLRIPPHIKFRV